MGELLYLRKEDAKDRLAAAQKDRLVTTQLFGLDPDYKIGYEPWGPSPLEPIIRSGKCGESVWDREGSH